MKPDHKPPVVVLGVAQAERDKGSAPGKGTTAAVVAVVEFVAAAAGSAVVAADVVCEAASVVVVVAVGVYVDEVEDASSGTERVDDLDRGGPVVADKLGRCRVDAEAVVVIVDRYPRVRVDVFVAVVDVLGNEVLDPRGLEGALTGRSPVLMLGWQGAGKKGDASEGTRSDPMSGPPLNSRTA